jgi:hypothetical protein
VGTPVADSVITVETVNTEVSVTIGKKVEKKPVGVLGGGMTPNVLDGSTVTGVSTSHNHFPVTMVKRCAIVESESKRTWEWLGTSCLCQQGNLHDIDCPHVYHDTGSKKLRTRGERRTVSSTDHIQINHGDTFILNTFHFLSPFSSAATPKTEIPSLAMDMQGTVQSGRIHT